MTNHLQAPPAQMLLYAFDQDARYEGRLVGALERMESAGALRILEARFVRRDPQTGELEAVDLRSRGAGSLVLPLVGFRLDPSERGRTTERALKAGALSDTLQQLGAELALGAAIAAVLVEHTWARALEDAAAQCGGSPVSRDFVDATSLVDLAPELRAAAARPGSPRTG